MQRFKQIVTVTLSIALLALPIAAWIQRQALIDYIRLRDYTPPADIAQIADTIALNDNGRKLFYVYHPMLLDREDFNKSCTNLEQSIVLGCYVEQTGIYLFDVQEERLAGVEEVTAAHEMLHVAYERLNGSERARVDALLDKAFNTVTNERIISVVESYRNRDPSIVPNELHSILGTEVRSLPIELEQYYRNYFDDRKAVVTLAEKYEKVFTEREEQVKQYDQQLATLKSQIDQLQAELSSLEVIITRARTNLNDLLANDATAQYNAAVPGFNGQVQSYNAMVARLQSVIDEHNNLVALRNNLVVEEQELVQAIDSRPSSLNTQ